MSAEAEPRSPVRFSVIIPAYNVERYIARCLRSVVGQSYPADEILVYDDGSTDGTAAIVAKFAEKHPNLRLIRQENTGQGAIRNRGVREARGDYLFFVDSDDEIDKTILAQCAALIADGAPDFVTFRYQARYPFGVRGYESSWGDQVTGRGELTGTDTELLFTNHWLSPWQSTYRADFIREHDLRNGEGYIFEDQEFTVAAILAADRVALLDAPLYSYHFNASSSLRAKSDVAHRRRIDGRRLSRHAILAALDRYGATPRARGILADHDVHDFVQEIVLGIYTETERAEVLAEITAFVNGVGPVDAAFLDPVLNEFYALPEADRTADALADSVRTLAVAERRRVAGSLAFRASLRLVRSQGPEHPDDALVDERFAGVFRSTPHRTLRRLGTAAGPIVRRVRRVVGPAR